MIYLLFFIVAFFYSSVGHGGASGYLAVMSFFGEIQPREASTTALILNLIVAGIGFVNYLRAGYFSLSFALPFVLASAPFAFLGGVIRVERVFYMLLLAGVLLFASFRLWFKDGISAGVLRVSLIVRFIIGSLIGLLSGIVGVGGGIFLSPLLILMKWAGAKETAAISAFFIFINSVAGLGGRAASGNFVVGELLVFMVVAVLGGFVGSYLGSRYFASLTVRRLLALVLIVASVKLILKAV